MIKNRSDEVRTNLMKCWTFKDIHFYVGLWFVQFLISKQRRYCLYERQRDDLIENFSLSFFKVYEKLAYVLNHWGELIPMNHNWELFIGVVCFNYCLTIAHIICFLIGNQRTLQTIEIYLLADNWIICRLPGEKHDFQQQHTNVLHTNLCSVRLVLIFF